MKNQYNHFETLGNRTFEHITSPNEIPCPFCGAPLYVELKTPIKPVTIQCMNPDCLCEATSVHDIESAVLTLEQVKEDLIIEKENHAYHMEFPKGDSQPED